MSVPYITDASFATEVLESPVPVLLDFTAAWCAPCRAIAPHLDALSAARGDALKVVKLDVDQNQETPSRYGVSSIPTLILFRDGKLVARQIGSVTPAALGAFVASVLS